jgi:membrane associated rhomboid family serine protease
MLLINVAIIMVLGVAVNVDNAAHLGGFVAGGVIGLLRARWPQPLPRPLGRALIGAALALTIAAFAIVHSYHGMH